MEVRILVWSLILGISGVNIWLSGWFEGHKTGYEEAMADVELGIKNPDDFFKDRMLRNVKK